MGEPHINDASRRHFMVYLNMIFASMMLLTAERRTYPPSAPIEETRECDRQA